MQVGGDAAKHAGAAARPSRSQRGQPDALAAGFALLLPLLYSTLGLRATARLLQGSLYTARGEGSPREQDQRGRELTMSRRL